jgi:hypothetical protein
MLCSIFNEIIIIIIIIITIIIISLTDIIKSNNDICNKV